MLSLLHRFEIDLTARRILIVSPRRLAYTFKLKGDRFRHISRILVLLVTVLFSYRSTSFRNVSHQKQRLNVYPVTQFGPNNQLLGFLQSMSLCSVLKVTCLEPALFPHFTSQRAMGASLIRFSDMYNTSELSYLESRPAEKLHLDAIITFKKQGHVCWPSERYLYGHGFSKTSPDHVRGQLIILNFHTREKAERETYALLQELIAQRNVNNVGLIYCDVFERPLPHNAKLRQAFRQLSYSLQPTDRYIDLANRALTTIGFDDMDYAAIHLRLRDGCETNFETCCCQTHKGSDVKISHDDLMVLIYNLSQVSGSSKVFVAAPPIFQNLTIGWQWGSLNVKTWYAPTPLLNEMEESLIHQIICAKSTLFVATVPQSTWSMTVALWRGKPLMKAASIGFSTGDA